MPFEISLIKRRHSSCPPKEGNYIEKPKVSFDKHPDFPGGISHDILFIGKKDPEGSLIRDYFFDKNAFAAI